MLKFNYFNADKTPFKQRLNESDERERKTSKMYFSFWKIVLFVLPIILKRESQSKLAAPFLLILYQSLS